ncbi:uncharacterized protein LOC117115274 isoform X2 [Anneissia japonica]|uniref:uncharacterized protein LOC117115274 isoform X2 n=1 Tax=Anneissia japonica TaxID=1529436 RepID=UPI0014254CD2|nr:uncharacterized protein LOC117115274 isoform X2 [Anneissia japonica]
MNYERNKDLENQACDYELINEIATDNWLSPAQVSLTKLDEIKRSSNFVSPSSAHRPSPRSRYYKSFVDLRAEPPLSKFPDNLVWGTNTSIQPLTTCPGECITAWSVIEASTTQNRFPESQKRTFKTVADKTEHTLKAKDIVSTDIISAPAPCPSPDLDVLVKQLQVSEEEEEEELHTIIPTHFYHQLHDSKASVKLLRRPIAHRPAVYGSIGDYQKDHHTFTRPQSCHCHLHQCDNEIRLSNEVDGTDSEGQKETSPVEKEPSQEILSSAIGVTTDVQQGEMTNCATKLKRCRSATSRCSVNSKGGSPSSLVRSSKPSVKSAQMKNQKCIERRRNREAVEALRDGSLLQHKKYTKLLFYEENLKLKRRKPEDEEGEIIEIVTAEEAKFGAEVIEMQQYLMTQGVHIPLHKLQRKLL